MIHAWNHEQADRLRGLGDASQLRLHFFEIIDSRTGSDIGVGPP